MGSVFIAVGFQVVGSLLHGWRQAIIARVHKFFTTGDFMPEHYITPLSSALCIDIGTHSQSVLMYRQGVAPYDMPRCVLPTPAQTLARRIRQCTNVRRDIYLSGPPMGGEFKPTLVAHIREGCRAAVAPETARTLFKSFAAAENAGFQVADLCPDGYELLHTGDIDMDFWRSLSAMFGFDLPSCVAVAAVDHGLVAPEYPEGDAFWLWRHVLRNASPNGAPLKDFILRSMPPEMPRLHAIQAVTGGLVTLTAAAVLLGVMGNQEIADRSFRQGIVLIHAGTTNTTAFLIWQNRVYGVYEQHTQGLDPVQTARDLADFRLGWLPNEAVRNKGGHGCVILDLPPEAEGFAPAYITGRERAILQGQGQMVNTFEDTALTGCLGLLYGLAASKRG